MGVLLRILIQLLAADDSPGTWAPVFHAEDLGGVPGAYLWPAPALPPPPLWQFGESTSARIKLFLKVRNSTSNEDMESLFFRLLDRKSDIWFLRNSRIGYGTPENVPPQLQGLWRSARGVNPWWPLGAPHFDPHAQHSPAIPASWVEHWSRQ